MIIDASQPPRSGIDVPPLATTAGGLTLSPAECLLFLRRRGTLRTIVVRALAEKAIREAARDSGLTVSDEELQQVANRFRRQHGLGSADRTHTWLTQYGRTALDFEAALEHDLLTEKLRDHLTRDRIADHFAVHRDDYARACLRLLVVPGNDLARELLSQLRDDGRDFADLARQHSHHASRAAGGSLGTVWRTQCSSAVAEAVSAARPGDIIGPLATPEGYHLLLIEETRPPELDAETTALIRQELFERWLGDKLKDATLSFPDDL
jgi:peptidylprolyl isomerase